MNLGFDPKAAAMRLRAVGLNRQQVHDIVSEVQKWITNNKEEWTVDRIKSIKVDLVRHFAGLPPTKTHSWIRYRKNGPKGPFGVLFKLPRKRFKVAWNAIMIYTGLVFQDPDIRVTARQWDKAVKAIKRPLLESSDLLDGLSAVHKSPFDVKVYLKETTGTSLVDYQVSPSRRAPKGFSTVPEVEAIVDSLRVLVERSQWTSKNWDILQGTVNGFEESVLPYVQMNLEWDKRAGVDPLDEDEAPWMGLISLIQEAGYKLRFAANPFRVYQMALQPLGLALFNALRRVPNDFTFDQEEGLHFVQDCLRDGLFACSTDLSNATDNSPLSFQLELLSKLGVPTRWLQFLSDTCKGDWYTRKKRSDPFERLSWSVGAPLGLYPTFPAFALWHHSVVQGCFHELDKPKIATRRGEVWPYALVGDDVTIMDAEVGQLYTAKMNSWGVPISEPKTLRSHATAEFLGRVITSNEVIMGFKWKGRCSDESFVDFARNFGPRSMIFMRPRQRRVLEYIADIPEPIGLGWNPFGIPLHERLNPALEKEWGREERLRTFSRRASRLYTLLFNSEDKSGTPVPSKEVVLDEYLASDQDAARVVSQLLPGFENLGPEIWPNVEQVVREFRPEMPAPLAAEFRSMLKRTSYVERRKEVPTLVMLERKVRRAVARSL